MAESDSRGAATTGPGRRGNDRRAEDRRRSDRRTPPPLWRRPSAFVGYGVAGALATVLLLQAFGTAEDEPAAPAPITDDVARVEDVTLPEVAPGEIREAFTVADYQTLVAEGDRAVGQVVRTELFCGSIASRSVREVEGAHPTLLALADADGRVGAAECRWSREGRSDDFLLVVPPALAGEFAAAPEEELNFVRRRRIPAHVEWLGRSQALALMYGGVLREIVR